jgi:eukaryotic-like serine/threonine-protein kinase
VGLPLLALAVVIALAVYLGSRISVSDDVTGDQAPVPSAPSSSAPAEGTAPPADASAPAITGATVYNPFGDGEPENPDEVPLSFDGDPSTAWSTVTYRGSPAFGNLKEGVGVLYDLGSEQTLAGIGVSGSDGATVEVRVGDQPDGDLGSYEVVADGELGASTDLSFDEPVTTRYVLLWVTGLVPSDGGFSAEVAEVTLTPSS